MIHRSSAGSAPDNGNAALTNEGFVNFLQCVLMSAHNDGRPLRQTRNQPGSPGFRESNRHSSRARLWAGSRECIRRASIGEILILGREAFVTVQA